jgi:hypothetical protein
MAKVKEITVGASYTYQPAQYHSAKGEAHYTVELEEGDDIDEVTEALREDLVTQIVMSLAGVDKLHEQIYIKGHKPEDLLDTPETDNEVLVEDDDDEDWGI